MAKDCEPFKLQPLDYHIMVEIDLQSLRNSIKTAKEHRSENIQIKVLTPKTKRTDRTTTFFLLQYNLDEVSSIFPYQSTTQTIEAEGQYLSIKATDNVWS